MNDILTLATRLRALDDRTLVAALRLRSPAVAGIKDFFDLAEALLDAASVQQALSRLDRHALGALATLGESDAPLTVTDLGAALGVDADTVRRRLARADTMLLAHLDGDSALVYGSVAGQLLSWPNLGLPSRKELTDGAAGHPPPPLADDAREAIDRLAAERAFNAVTLVTALVLELEREPGRELAKGGIALPDRKRLASALVTETESVTDVLTVAEHAGLVTRDHGNWLATERGSAWLLEATPARWLALAEGWLSSLLPETREVLLEFSHSTWGDALTAHLAWRYPAGGEWMQQRASSFVQRAELLGITGGEAPSSPGALLLAGRPAAAAEALERLLPAEVEKVYVQHDLSVVAPGPLTPATDARLRLVADVENRALAATYRVSQSSLNRALASGETAASILEFLRSVSLTGIPQPLDYLVTESATRYGLVRVGELRGEGTQPGDPEYGARSYLRSDDTDLLGTIAVDQSLRSLGLVRIGAHRVVSRFPLDLVFWALSDARYPVAAEDSLGEIVLLQRQRVAGPARSPVTDPLAELVERLRVGDRAQPAETHRAWLLRQLDAAVRGRVALTVSVTMPDGSVTDLHLEPASIAGGRLRARDRRSDIERTLPLSSIAAVGPAPVD